MSLLNGTKTLTLYGTGSKYDSRTLLKTDVEEEAELSRRGGCVRFWRDSTYTSGLTLYVLLHSSCGKIFGEDWSASETDSGSWPLYIVCVNVKVCLLLHRIWEHVCQEGHWAHWNCGGAARTVLVEVPGHFQRGCQQDVRCKFSVSLCSLYKN